MRDRGAGCSPGGTGVQGAAREGEGVRTGVQGAAREGVVIDRPRRC